VNERRSGSLSTGRVRFSYYMYMVIRKSNTAGPKTAPRPGGMLGHIGGMHSDSVFTAGSMQLGNRASFIELANSPATARVELG